MNLKKIFLSLLAVFCLWGITDVTAQQWVEKMQDPNVNFYEVQKSFHEYWKDRPMERSKGYKQFKRWEYFMQPRVFPTGSRIDKASLWKSYQEIKRNKSTQALDIANWQFMGPTNPPSNGGDAGRINCIAFHPTNANIMYVGAPSGGLWKTVDGGSSWFSLTDHLPVIGVSSIVVDYNNPQNVYIATGDGDANDTYSIGVLKSTDGGQTWNTTGLSLNVTENRTVNKIIQHPTDPNTLFAATSYGIFKTTDGGATWVKKTFSYVRDLIFKPGDPSVMYYTSNSAFYKSVNGGNTFQFVTVSFNTSPNRIQMGVSEANPSYVYLLCGKSADNGYGGLYLSTDEGATFSLRSSSPNLMGWQVNGSDAGGQSWYDLAIAVDPMNANNVYIGGVNIWKSINGGSSWGICAHWTGGNGNVPYVHADIHALAFATNKTTLYAGSDGGVYVTANAGGSWTMKSNGLSVAQMYKISCAYTAPYTRILSGWQDNGSNLANTSTWSQVFGGDGMDCLVNYNNYNVFYISTPNGSFYRSNNSGQNFTSITSSITQSEEGNWVTPIKFHPTNPAILYAGYINLWKSINSGDSWSKISNFASTDQIIALAVAPSDANRIYVAKNNELEVTTDGGTTWTDRTVGLPSLAITDVMVHPTNPNKVWVTLSGYTDGSKVFLSNDGGATWTNISGTLPNIPTNCIVYEKNSADGIYLGTDVGVYYKDNNLTDWVPFMNGLPNVVVNDLEIISQINEIRAGTYGRGLWKCPTYGVSTVSDIQKRTPKMEIFPNPVQNQLNLSFNEMVLEDATIQISDVQGKSIFSDKISTGFQSYSVDLSNQSDGTYIVSVITKSTSQSIKFIKGNSK